MCITHRQYNGLLTDSVPVWNAGRVNVQHLAHKVSLFHQGSRESKERERKGGGREGEREMRREGGEGGRERGK